MVLLEGLVDLACRERSNEAHIDTWRHAMWKLIAKIAVIVLTAAVQVAEAASRYRARA